MGARKEEYERVAPHNSFIHVDDFGSPKELARYLQELDKDDDAYNEYFRWKGTGEIIDTLFWCRVCALLHDPDRKPKYYADVDSWWKNGTCW
jgi:glycoprotein 3-alpha-L-fucosyltransferase